VDVHGDTAAVTAAGETIWYRRSGTTWAFVQSTSGGGGVAFDDTRAVSIESSSAHVLTFTSGQWSPAWPPYTLPGRAVSVAMQGRTVVVLLRGGDLEVFRHDDTTLTPLATLVHPATCTYTSVATDGTRIAAACDGGLGGQIDVYAWDGARATRTLSYPVGSPSSSAASGVALRGGLLAWVEADLPGTCAETWWVHAVRLGTSTVDLGSWGPVAATSVATDGTSVFAGATVDAVAQLVPEADWTRRALVGPVGSTPGWRTTYGGTPWDPRRQALAAADGWLVRGNPSFRDGVVFFVPIRP
jgi:hypothetical protein